MNAVDKAVETQLKNIQTKTGKTLEDLFGVIRHSGLTKHGDIRELLQRDLGLGFGDANTLVHAFRASESASPAPAQVVGGGAIDEIYAGPKAALRPVHDAVMAVISAFGPFEIAPKKGYVSLRRKKQFAMIGPGTKSRVEVGLNMKGQQPTARLTELPAGGMCQYRVYVTNANEVDAELVAWIRTAYDSAG